MFVRLLTSLLVESNRKPSKKQALRYQIVIEWPSIPCHRDVQTRAKPDQSALTAIRYNFPLSTLISLQPLHSPPNPLSQSLQRLVILSLMTLLQQHSQVRQSLLHLQRTLQRSHSKPLLRLGSRLSRRREILEHRRVKIRLVRKGGASAVPGFKS
jgi:hypothetical protein